MGGGGCTRLVAVLCCVSNYITASEKGKMQAVKNAQPPSVHILDNRMIQLYQHASQLTHISYTFKMNVSAKYVTGLL